MATTSKAGRNQYLKIPNKTAPLGLGKTEVHNSWFIN